MRTFAVVMLLMVSCACNSVNTRARKPVEDNKYEQLVVWDCNGKKDWNWKGTSSCQFSKGDETDIWVKLPPTKGQVVLRSTRKEVVSDFSKGGWFKTVWKFEDFLDSKAIVVSVTGMNTGVHMAKMYPYVQDEDRPKMSQGFELYCFEDGDYKKAEGVWSCQQPAGAEVDGRVLLDPEEKGKYLISAQGCELVFPERTGEFDKEDALDVKITRSEPGHCAVKVAVKYASGKITEGELYMDWWDHRYVPLSPPELEEKDGKLKACYPDGFKYVELNEESHGRAIGKCTSEKLKNGLNYGIGWDGSGRVSYGLYWRDNGH